MQLESRINNLEETFQLENRGEQFTLRELFFALPMIELSSRYDLEEFKEKMDLIQQQLSRKRFQYVHRYFEIVIEEEILINDSERNFEEIYGEDKHCLIAKFVADLLEMSMEQFERFMPMQSHEGWYTPVPIMIDLLYRANFYYWLYHYRNKEEIRINFHKQVLV